MPCLADIQAEMRRALVSGETAGIAPLLARGSKRFEIHRRQYETSLVAALLGKFPVTIWLVGEPFVAAAAREYIRQFPPQAPCIAEYGENFPRFLAASAGAERIPYLCEFAELEWHVGHVASAADQQSETLAYLTSIPSNELPDAVLKMQGGLRYFQTSWPVDELIKIYLTDTAPEQLEFEATKVWLEIHGSRGAFELKRLDAGEFEFRKSICGGQRIGNAIEAALRVNADFEPGQALVALIAAGLIVAMDHKARVLSSE
jgi:hypothetical protein